MRRDIDDGSTLWKHREGVMLTCCTYDLDSTDVHRQCIGNRNSLESATAQTTLQMSYSAFSSQGRVQTWDSVQIGQEVNVSGTSYMKYGGGYQPSSMCKYHSVL